MKEIHRGALVVIRLPELKIQFDTEEFLWFQLFLFQRRHNDKDTKVKKHMIFKIPGHVLKGFFNLVSLPSYNYNFLEFNKTRENAKG